MAETERGDTMLSPLMTSPANQLALPSPEWFEIKGRLFRFLGTHPGWTRWQDAESGTWNCSQERDRDRDLSRDARIAAIVHDPRSIPSRSMPEQHAFADVTAAGWNRLLLGIFTYLGGPAHLDDVVTIASVLLRLPGAAALPTGSRVAFPDPSAEHVSYEQMDAIVDNTLDATARESITAHILSCPFCARQLASYQSAAEQVSAPIQKPKTI